MNDPKDLNSYAETLHSYLRELPTNIDVKISIYLTINIGVILYLSNIPHAAIDGDLIKDLARLRIFDFFPRVAIVAMSMSTLFSIIALWPRSIGNPKNGFSFASIGRYGGAASYYSRVKELDGHQLTEAIIRHCFELARLTAAKIMWFRLALLVGAIGFLTAIATISLQGRISQTFG